jgi:hypothetical protein
MQKFTRPITREIELADGRLALTMTEQGLTVRPVGSRKPPAEITWAAILCYMTGRGAPGSNTATPEQVQAAVESLKRGEFTHPAPHTATQPATSAPASHTATTAPHPAHAGGHGGEHAAASHGTSHAGAGHSTHSTTP